MDLLLSHCKTPCSDICNGLLNCRSYGIEAIALWHEDPFGHDKIDINMDEIVEDARKEVFVLLNAWQNQRQVGEALFSD